MLKMATKGERYHSIRSRISATWLQMSKKTLNSKMMETIEKLVVNSRCESDSCDGAIVQYLYFECVSQSVETVMINKVLVFAVCTLLTKLW